MILTFRKAWVQAFSRWLVGGFLIAAGVAKIRGAQGVAEYLASFRVFPPQASQILAVVLPWWEFSAGLLIVLGIWMIPAALFSSALFASFLGWAALDWASAGGTSCPCFGALEIPHSLPARVFIASVGLGLSLLLGLGGFASHSGARSLTPSDVREEVPAAR